MALTLAQAESRVRTRTKHTSDTVRLTQAVLREYINEELHDLRTWLQQVAPALYLLRSADLPVAAGATVNLISVSATFARIYKVEQLISDMWRPLEAADPLDPNQHQAGGPTWRLEGTTLYVGPDNRDAVTIRILYYATPATASDANGELPIPEPLERALIYGTCALVALGDGDDPTTFANLRNAALAEVKPTLRAQYGIHPQRAGLQRVMGY